MFGCFRIKEVRDKDNETGLKEGGGIEMSIYSAFHIRDARSLSLLLLKYLPSSNILTSSSAFSFSFNKPCKVLLTPFNLSLVSLAVRSAMFNSRSILEIKVARAKKSYLSFSFPFKNFLDVSWSNTQQGLPTWILNLSIIWSTLKKKKKIVISQ